MTNADDLYFSGMGDDEGELEYPPLAAMPEDGSLYLVLFVLAITIFALMLIFLMAHHFFCAKGRGRVTHFPTPSIFNWSNRVKFEKLPMQQVHEHI